MNTLLKILAFAGLLIIIIKGVQIAIDVLYNNCGKKYVTTQAD